MIGLKVKEKKSNRFVQYLCIGSKPGKIPELDGLRAFAILLVLFYHFSTSYSEYAGSYYRAITSDFFHRLMHNGWLGVDLFFVLSGYLIFNHLIKIQKQSNQVQNYGRYALKRILRTFPLYYAIIVLFVWVIAPNHTGHLNGTDYLIHFLFLQDYLGSNILTPLWSLATEEKFYLLAPFILLLLKKFTVKQSVAILLVLMLTITLIKTLFIFGHDGQLRYGNFFLIYRAPFQYAIVSIVMGVVVAYVANMRLSNGLPKIGSGAAIVVVYILCFVDFHYSEHWYWVSIWHFLTVLLFGILILTAVKYTGNKWMSFLRGRFLRMISVLSYSLYLSHMAILPWLYKLHKYWVRSEEAWVHSLTFFVMYIGLSLLLSLVLHYIVEKPFLIIKDKL